MLLVLGAVSLSISPGVARAAPMVPVHSADQRVEGVKTGELLLNAGADGFTRALLQRSEFAITVTGMLARVELTQSFLNDSTGYAEGVYAFPLPDRAAVAAMTMTIGNRLIRGVVREREEAQAIYTSARQAGKKAGLVEQQRPNLFTTRVANIAPGERIDVTLSYVQPVDLQSGRFSLRVPTTITPRYIPGAPLRAAALSHEDDATTHRETATLPALDPLGWSLPTNEVADAHQITPYLHPADGDDNVPINPLTVTVDLRVGLPMSSVSSPYHDIHLEKQGRNFRVFLKQGVVEMNRDFVLEWAPVSGSSAEAAFFTEQVGDQYYGLLMLVPPQRDVGAQPIAREMTFVIDTSGSMGGTSIQQARASLDYALQQLRPQDSFNVIAFDSAHSALYPAPVRATRHFIQRAREFVRSLHASGGTEMLSALQAALPAASVSEDGRAPTVRQVVFITDGAVGNESALFTEIARRIGDRRLFTVGIGSAPNGWFMRKAAEFGRGTHTQIGDLGEVGDKMRLLFEQLAHPVVVDLHVDWPFTVDVAPQRVPDLYYGEPLTMAVNFGSRAPRGDVVVSGLTGQSRWQRRLGMDGAQVEASPSGIGSIWARRKIAGLLDEKRMGRPAQAVRSEVLAIAIEHQLLSPYTSFVAVEEIISRAADAELHSQAVPNTRPQGQHPQPFAFPRTATTGPAKLWFAAFACFIAIFIRGVCVREDDNP